MQCDANSDDIPTARGDKSSLRAQLIEAQILDGQLANGGIIDDLLVENYAASIADRNAQKQGHEITLRELDDAITRLREWQLGRETKSEEPVHILMDQSDAHTSSIESDGRENDIKNHILKHVVQSRKTEESLASMKCLLSPEDHKGNMDHLVDLSRLVEQNNMMPLEHFRDTQNLVKEIEDSNYRRIMEEVRISSSLAAIEKENEVLVSGSNLDANATRITDRYDSFSSALDCLLGIGAQSDCLDSVFQEAANFEDVRDDCNDSTEDSNCDGGVKNVGIAGPESAPPPRPPPRKAKCLMWDCRKGD